MTVIYKDVKTLTEIGTVTGQQTKALVMYDTSTGAAEGLDVEALIGMEADIEALESAVTISVEGIDATDVNGALADVLTQIAGKADTTVIGDIDTILDILNGDLEGDIQEIIDNMVGV